jgi:tetratricopeptide (TPR) repeat protein
LSGWRPTGAAARLALGLALLCPGSAVQAQDAPVEETALEAPSAGEAEPAAPAPAAAARVSDPRPSLALERLERAWSAPAESLAERASRARAAADEMSLADVDPLARALLLDAASGASPLERAGAAVLLAPGLPLAHAALARAEWERGARGAALAAAGHALRALPAHLDGWLWLGVAGSLLAVFALAGGSFLFLLARGIATARFAAHDAGDALEPSMPPFARAALVAALVLAPAALGEGLAGAALGLFALGLLAPAREQRVALVAAAACFVAALHPGIDLAGARVAAVGSDAVALASWSAERGFLDPIDAERLARASTPRGDGPGPDPLALQAAAQWAQRSGDLAAADATYAALLARVESDPVVLNNAANVKLALGATPAAIELYRRAIEVEPSALLWFNLSQAHGAAIDVEQHDRALAAAQSLDPVTVSELTTRLAGANAAYAAELPLPQGHVRERLLLGDAAAASAELRQRIAPGWLGASPWIAGIAFAAAAALGLALGRRLEASSACLDCGTHLCRRCGTTPRGDGRCDACQKRRFQRHAGAWDGAGRPRSLADRALRAIRLLAPGLVGWSGRRCALGLPAAIAASALLGLALGFGSALPDPGGVGGAAALAERAAAALAVAILAACAALQALRERRSRS